LEFRLTQGRHYYKDIDNKILNTVRQATTGAKGEPHAPSIGDWWLGMARLDMASLLVCVLLMSTKFFLFFILILLL
jgi:hypothetical protein